MLNTVKPTLRPGHRPVAIGVGLAITLWGGAVALAAGSGLLALVPMPMLAAFVAASIALPVALYFYSPALRSLADGLGHRPIVFFHIWRIPAALLFFAFGFAGELPWLFWVLAGTGDMIAGLMALYTVLRPENARRYLRFHVIGFPDFVVAVGTGLTFTLLQDPLMIPIAALPLALIPLWGVGISGATHLIAFDMIRRQTGWRMPAHLDARLPGSI